MTNTLAKSIRIQYLKAMDIQLWVRRNFSEPSPPLTPVAQQTPVAVTPQEPLTALPTSVAAILKELNPTSMVDAKMAQPIVVTTIVNQITTVPMSPQSSPPPPNSFSLMPVNSLDWEDLQARVAACQACELHRTRTQTVLGTGNRQADWMFIGEAPGAEEDMQGQPFVGKAGQLLNNMLHAINLKREEIYITNVIKCRPPDNRNPHQEEMTHCYAFLQRQIALIQPKLIIAVGKIAAQHLLAVDTPIGKLRGQRFEYGENNLPLLATYHPAYLLRRPSEKRQSWRDLQFIHQIMAELKKS